MNIELDIDRKNTAANISNRQPEVSQINGDQSKIKKDEGQIENGKINTAKTKDRVIVPVKYSFCNYLCSSIKLAINRNNIKTTSGKLCILWTKLAEADKVRD